MTSGHADTAWLPPGIESRLTVRAHTAGIYLCDFLGGASSMLNLKSPQIEARRSPRGAQVFGVWCLVFGLICTTAVTLTRRGSLPAGIYLFDFEALKFFGDFEFNMK